ncbi:MAG: DNA-directed RNA polymerase subunit omega, partial [Crocinitomicaceae bacterium]|nr:DNA-directed RNA polymerase subunit omega [Crocinitomicaceae bacterium]
MSYKNVVAEKTTVTRDTIRIEEKTGNIYESIVAVSKRSNQISVEIKEELTSKLQEFASS